MTAVDHAELKRLAEGATPGEWRVSEDNNPFADGRHVFAKGLDGTDFVVLNLKTDQTFVTATSRVQQQRNAKFSAAANPAVVLELLSEIEGLKARIKCLEKLGGEQSLRVMEQATRAKDAESALANLRTQAPDSWRPDFVDVKAMMIEAYFSGWEDGSCGDEYDAWTAAAESERLIDERAPALRPQTAESGK